MKSQLHHAADYCETTFFKSEAKREWVLSTLLLPIWMLFSILCFYLWQFAIRFKIHFPYGGPCRHDMWPVMSTWQMLFILVLNNLLTFVACEGPFGVSPWCCTSPYKCRLGLRSSFSTLVLGLSCVPKSIGITIKFWHNIIHKSMNANN